MTDPTVHHAWSRAAHAPDQDPSPTPPPSAPSFLPPPPAPGWQRPVLPPPPAPPGWAPPPASPPSPPPWTAPLPPHPPGPGFAGPRPPAPEPSSEPSRPPVGLQNLLLGLGTALVAIALVVFTAVNWSQLDASVQGLLLVAVTVAAAMAASVAARREMPATAEALGTVAVLLALADVHAFRVGLAPEADGSLFWAVGFALVAVLAAALGRVNAIRAPQIAAGLVAQLPLLCVLEASEASVWVVQLAVVAQAFAVLFAADRIDRPRWARRVAAAWALVAASTATAAIVLASIFGDLLTTDPIDLHRGVTGLGLAAAAALALYVAWLRMESEAIRPLALLGATSLGLAAVWFATVDAVGSDTAVGFVALSAALVVAGSLRVPKQWGEVPAIIAGVTGAGAVLPLVGAIASMLVAASTVSAEAWQRSGSQVAAGLQLAEAHDYRPAALVLQLGALAVGGTALFWRRGTTALSISTAVLALATLVVGPLVASSTITATVVVTLAAATAGVLVAVVVGARHRVFPVAVGFSVGAWAWAAAWSLATPALTFAALGAGVVAALAVAVVARRDGAAAIGASAAASVVVTAPLLVSLVAWDRGVSAPAAWAVASVVAAMCSVIGVVLLDPKGAGPAVSRVMREAVEVATVVIYLGALAGTAARADADAASVALAAGVLGFGLHAARPRRILCGLVAAAELLVLIWLRLGQAEVVVVEAYTLPLAAMLLATGFIGARLTRDDGGEPGSWITYGPSLVVALAPTVWLAFGEPGTIRPLIGLVAGALVLVGGVVWGKRAFVDVGTATVVALGLHQIAPVVGEIPNWATIGATGVLLLGVGATFEQRRRDLKAVLRAYSALT